MREIYETIEISPGDVIIREGEINPGIYVLRRGVLEVRIGGTLVAEISEEGSFFGEMSSILGRPRTATVCAKTEAEVVHIPQGIDRLIEAHPRLAHVLIHSFATRLVETSSRLVYGNKISGT